MAGQAFVAGPTAIDHMPQIGHTLIKGYRIFTMLNILGKLLEIFVARRLAREL